MKFSREKLVKTTGTKVTKTMFYGKYPHSCWGRLGWMPHSYSLGAGHSWTRRECWIHTFKTQSGSNEPRGSPKEQVNFYLVKTLTDLTYVRAPNESELNFLQTFKPDTYFQNTRNNKHERKKKIKKQTLNTASVFLEKLTWRTLNDNKLLSY